MIPRPFQSSLIFWRPLLSPISYPPAQRHHRGSNLNLSTTARPQVVVVVNHNFVRNLDQPSGCANSLRSARYASTLSTTLSPTTPSTRVNPPESTHAPPLNVPKRSADQGIASYLLQCGKAYTAFYKEGVRRVWENHKLARQASSKLRNVARNPKGVARLSNVTTSTGVVSLPPLSRAEWQVMRRSRRDILRLPGFGLLVLLLGEWIPLIALWITPVVPIPCRIPPQVRKELEGLERRRQERIRKLRAVHALPETPPQERSNNTPHTPTQSAARKVSDSATCDIKHLDALTLQKLSAQLSAHSAIWDLLNLNPPTSLLRWKVGRRLQYLDIDDAMIRRDGGVKALNVEEIRLACIERGFDTLGKTEIELRRSLAEWFGQAK
ncbi:hypothetical protein AOQ84DRAFT_356217 [Glonium stellatum]|uniref:Letm1 RBD domain-containing protein n=1 Tax=Glonium stellatum TaxID=574774 RepID=A0A8E2EU30_9PEZI|nr:hypothetical protein AOQ84DRAFT_356217 [Glonium stellatum]